MKLAFFAAKGGAGTSTVAAQVARHLARRPGYRVAVIEPYSTDMATLLNPRHNAQLPLSTNRDRVESSNLQTPTDEPYIFTLRYPMEDPWIYSAIADTLADPQWDDVLVDMGTMSPNGSKIMKHDRTARAQIMDLCDKRFLVSKSDVVAIQRAADLYNELQNPQPYRIDGFVHVGTYDVEAGDETTQNSMAEAMPVPMAGAFHWDRFIIGAAGHLRGHTPGHVTTSIKSLLKNVVQSTEDRH